METINLPSGAELRIALAPFKDGKALYQAMFDEMKSLKIDIKTEMDANFIKDIFCVGMSSEKIEKALWKCFDKCLYNNSKISEASFEPAECRDDYITLCFEVAKANLMPFMKSLYAQYGHLLQMIQKDLTSPSKTTP